MVLTYQKGNTISLGRGFNKSWGLQRVGEISFFRRVLFSPGCVIASTSWIADRHISMASNRLRKGDLLFFGSKNNGTSHVTHVAIYLGNNEYINSSGRVQINSLDPTKEDYNSHRMSSLLMAKRILGVENDQGIKTCKQATMVVKILK